MATPTLVTGDNLILPVELTKKNYDSNVNATFVIDPGATLVARIVSADKESTYTAEISQTLVRAGADLANSLVVIEFTTADTIGVTQQGAALLEIQVDDSGKLTWFTPIRLARGQIA